MKHENDDILAFLLINIFNLAKQFYINYGIFLLLYITRGTYIIRTVFFFLKKNETIILLFGVLFPLKDFLQHLFKILAEVKAKFNVRFFKIMSAIYTESKWS